MRRESIRNLCVAALLLLIPSIGEAQRGGRGGRGGPPPSAREAAPVDFTGDWVSIITEDWRWRMVTPARGDFAGIPLNQEGRRVGDAWDPDEVEAAGAECRAYGAGGIMRAPTRLHIVWEDDETLRIDTDAGMQTRVFNFGGERPADWVPTFQGYSSARWEPAIRGAGTPRAGLGAVRVGSGGRTLEVVTTGLRAGYVRKNGAPYSDGAVVREYYSLYNVPGGDTWFVVTTIVEDSTYLSEPFVTSTDFKKIPDGEGWNPTPCSAR